MVGCWRIPIVLFVKLKPRHVRVVIIDGETIVRAVDNRETHLL